MIDELAKAIADEGKAEWDDLPEDSRTILRRSAAAVLRRLREPTEAMLAAGTAAITGGPEPDPDYAADAEAMFAAMIDAALGEKA